MNLSDPKDALWSYGEERERSPQTELDKMHDSLYQMRYGGAMDEGQDTHTCLICVTNSLLTLMSYLRKRDESE